jgi:hypothetical protein
LTAARAVRALASCRVRSPPPDAAMIKGAKNSHKHRTEHRGSGHMRPDGGATLKVMTDSRAHQEGDPVRARAVAQSHVADREDVDHGGGELMFKLIVGLATAIGTGIGAAAFLTFVGGAVMTARFRGVGVSGTSAVALVEKQELLAVGADQLVSFVTVSVVAALLTCALYGLASHASWMGSRFESRTVRVAILGAAVVGGTLYYYMHARVNLRRSDASVFALGIVTLVVGAVVVELLAGPAISARQVPTGRSLSASRGTHIALVASICFASVMLFGAAETYSYNYRFPEVRPAALVLSDRQTVMYGYYVGASNGHIYVARRSSLGLHLRSQRLEGLPNAEVLDVALGATMTPSRADRVAKALCRNLLAAAKRERADTWTCEGP